jgi:uncharacterized repeat protein (TIGR01451 family)/fimbrial isopeptide formation D2 family protein
MRNRWLSLLTLLSLTSNLLTVSTVAASPAEYTSPAAEYVTRARPLSSIWLLPPPLGYTNPGIDLLPSWFSLLPTEHETRNTEYGTRNTEYETRSTQSDTHHTIYPSAVTVTGPEGPINNCDVVTFTVVAANDAVTTTNVLITSTMPAGFTPTQVVFNVGTVAPNEVITRHAVFSATCNAVSGQNVVTLTQDGADPIVRYTDFVVNPGAITVRKEPAMIQAAPGDVVTWTVTVENTGYGTVSNVRVTDTLGSGLQYVSGLTSAYVISIPVGGVVTFPISAHVVGCSGLVNMVTATWGCNGQQCLTPQTAKGAVDLAMINPDLDFSLPSFDVPYCAGFGVFTVSITNNGDGTAYSGTLAVDLSPFSVTVAPPASYSGGAFHLPDIPPGETYNLVFTLTLPSAVCTMPRSGTFYFNLRYYDRCGNPYTELPQSADWQPVDTPGRLSVSKSMPREVYRSQTVTTTVTVDASGIVGTIVVTDRVPAGWSVVNPAGGNVFTVGGVIYITWTLTGSATLNPVFATPGVDGCAYCGTLATNVVTATASDCQNCLQTATAQATAYLQCEEPVATTFKQVSGPAETCTDPAFTYTNTYVFADTFIVTPTWGGMVFTDALPYQTYVTGSASVWMSNGTNTCTATFDILGTAPLVIGNISPTCAITVPGATMWISYQTAVAEPAACSDFEWYDWSYLNLGVTGNAECAADGVIEEGVFVQTLAPAMTLGLSGLPPWVSSCGVYTVTLTAQRTSAVPAYDAVIDVPTSTFHILEVLGFSGATPAYTTTDGLGYHWYYSDTFAQPPPTGTVQLRVQLRCGSGTAPFTGTLYYDNRCANNDAYRERCSAGGILDAPPVVQPLPILTKFPEVIYAHGDVVTWTLTAYNSGAGPAHSVVLTDLLGSGLRYVDSAITSTGGSVAGVTPVTSSHLVTWNLPVIQPKERVTIRFAAEIIGCADLTNRFAGAQGCLGQTCQSGGPVVSRVELPPAILLNTNQAVTPIDTCYTRTVTVTVRNAGLLSVYSATLTQTLPAGLSYVINTTQVSTDAVNWQPGPNPTIVGQNLYWGPGSGAPLDALLSRIRPGETVYLRYDVYASCPFGGGQLRIQTGYRDTCGNPYLTEASYFVMPVRTSDLRITKVGQNLDRPSPAPDLIYAEPGETVVFTVTVSNPDAAAPAREVVVTDTLPGNVVFWGASLGYTGPAPGSLGGVITWTFDVISPATTVVLTVTTVVSQPEGCTVADTVNRAEVAWGCPDGCRQSARSDLVTLRTRPVYGTPIIRTDIPPATLHQCGGEITITLNNQGPPAYNVTLTDTLPSGYVFSHTVRASTPPSGTVDLGQTVVYTWGVLPTGLTTLTLAVRNSVGAGSCATPSGPNVITMTYDDDVPDCYHTGPYSATATQAINVISPTLVVDKSPATLTAQVGQRITWTLRMTNTGSGTAYNVVVTDVVGSTFTDIVATNGSDGALPTIAGYVITWTPNPIPAGGTWTAQVSAVLIASGGNRNVVTATASCDTGCLAISAGDVAYVTLMQAFDKGPAIQTGTIGTLAVFTFTTYLPDQDSIYENLTLTDTLPTGLGYVSSTLVYTYGPGPTTLISTTPTITPGHLASGNVVWRLGNITGPVQVDGILTAVIQNIPAISETARLTNILRMTYVDDGQLYAYTDTANVDVLEPLLHLGKSYVTPYGCGATLLQDNFNTGVIGWAITGGGTWAWTNGVYQAPTGGTGIGRISRKGDTGWTDYSYSAMIRSTSTTGHFGLVFRGPISGTNTFYRFRWGTETSNNRRLERIVDNSIQTILAQHTAAYVPGRWYHVEVRAEGNRIRVYVDGILVFDVTDTSANALTNGNIGVYAINQTYAYFDDILVTRLGNQSCYVGANDRVTYTLTVSNQGRIPGYDLVITDVLPAGLSLVTYTLTSDDPTAAIVAAPAPIPGATGVLTWGMNHLTPTVPYTWARHTAITLNVVLQVADWITANTVLSNQAFLSYSSQPGSGPVGVERAYSGGSHSTAVQTVNGNIRKSVTFRPPPTATLGTLVTYTLIVPDPPISATLYTVRVTDTIDSRMQIVTVTTGGGTGASSGWAGQVVTASFASIPHSTQAFVTITTRISHEWPNAAGDANAGDVLTDVARMSHATAPVTDSNVVSTTVGEPNVRVDKDVRSSTGSLSDLDGTALLTYTIRLTNTGSSPAYSVYITDAVPAGISVTALYGGDSRSGPVVGPGVLTWTVGTISNTAPANVAVLTYTARVSQALSNAWLTNTVSILSHSLTDTIPGVRPYTATDRITVTTGLPALSKATAPPVLRVGDIVTYHLVFTVPAGTVGMGGNSYLRDVLPSGVWYITDSERLTWTPPTVGVTFTARTTGTLAGSQVVTWTFGQPITSEQDLPTVITLTFRAQAVGLQIDTLAPVWPTQTVTHTITNTVGLWQRGVFIDDDSVTNQVIQPFLSIAKSSTPPPGAFVGANDLITYRITITNTGHGPAYDIVLSDTLPAGLIYESSGITSTAPPTIAFTAWPPVGATGVLTWRVNELWGRAWNAGQPGVAVITMVARVTDTIGANLRLTNTAAIPYYDSQPGDGPGPYAPDEREYTNGADTVFHRTVDAAITKTVTPPTATLGDVITYVIVVPAPPITATLYNVTVTDRLDSRLQLHTVINGPDGTVIAVGNIFTVTYPAIPHGQQRFITVTAVLSSPLGAVAGQVVTNLAVLRHQDGGPTPSDQPVFTVTEPALALVKASDPPTSSTVRVGEPVTYTVRITNASGVTRSPAYDVILTDTLPVGMRAAPPVLIAVTLNGAPVAPTDYITGYAPATGHFTVTFTPAFSIPVGGELVIRYGATVDSDVPAAVNLTNRAEVTWSSLPGPVPGDRDYGPISGTTTLHTPLAVGLIKSVAPPTVTIGSQVVFSVTLPVPPVGAVLHNVAFTDVLDSRLRIDAVSPNAAFSGQVVTATFTTIPTYTQRTIVITATVRDLVTVTAGTQISNVAVFDYRDNPSGPIPSNPVTVTVAEPRVTLDKSVQVPRDPLGAGDLVTYTLALSNTGTWPVYDLVVTDTLPAGLAFVATVGFTVTDPVTAALGGDYPAWTVSQLNVGGFVYITFTARVAPDIGAGLILTNSAWGRTDGQPGPNPDQREYPIPTDTVPVNTGYPRLDIEKSAEPSPVEAGGLLTYTLTVTNTGIVSATGVVVTDAVPANTAYLSCGPVPCGEAGGVVSWTLGVLDIGIPRVLTMRVRVNSPLPNGTILTNTAWVTSTEGLTDTDTVTTPVTSAPILHLAKSSTDADGAPLRPGDRLTYTLVVSNSGNETATGITIRDTVPAHTTYVPGSIAGGDSRSDAGLPVLVWTINALPPNVPIYLTFAVTVNLPLTDGLPIVNTGAVTSTQVPTPTTDTVTDTVTSSHTLEVVKSASPSPVQAGGLLTYTLAYTITGDEPVYGVVVSDTTPANTTFWAAIPSAASDPGVGGIGPVVWNLGDFLPPESGITQATGVLTLVVLVDTPLVSGTVITNAVLITDTSGLTDTDTVTTPVTSAHALHITKTASPSPVQAGDLLTYTIAWAVSGNEPAFGVTVSDTVPVSTSYVACYPAAICSEAGGRVTWSLGDRYPPASGAVTLVVRVDTPLVSGTVIANAVLITDTSGLTDTDTVTTPVTSAHALHITKTASPSPVQAGDLLTYTIAWAVSGNEPAFGVTVSDTVPVSTSYVACYPAAICSEAGGRVTWSLGDRYPPASGAVTLVVRVDSAVPSGTLIYNAVAITDTSDITDTDDVTTPVETRADLAVAKADEPDPVIVGTLLTYTLVVTNHGPSVARDAVVTDTLPPEVAFVSADPTPDSGPNPLVWLLGDLAVGEARRLTVTVRVLVTTTDIFTNAVVVGSDTPDDNPGNNQDDEPTTPLVPGLELTKDVAPGQAVRSMPFTYTVRITNTGQVTFDPLVLTDTLPADFYYVAGSGDPRDPDLIAEPLLVWSNLGPLAPGQSLTVTFAVTATPGITGTYWNVALVGGEYPGGVLTDTDDAPVALTDPAIALDKQLVAADLDDVFPNYVTFTIVITNVGISTIDRLPLVDQYDPYYLSFVTAEPYPDEPADDGLITWYDLTASFERNLAPGEAFRVTTVFRVVRDITTTVNTAIVEGPYDVYDNPANEPRDDEPITNIPTAVELLYFRVGSVAGRSVRLEWATAVEIDNFGFWLYRAPVADFARAEGVDFVPSEARGGGATYVYNDTVPYDGVWWYWLADVDTQGRETLHGPVSARVGIAALPYRVYLPLVLR